jgi:HEAT repeat protein
MPPLSKLSVNELMTIGLQEVADENEALERSWRAIHELHRRGGIEVLQAARRLLSSDVPMERALGCAVLGQLGGPDRPYGEESVPALLDLADREPDAMVLSYTTAALGHLEDTRARDTLLRLSRHADSRVRFNVTIALTSCIGRNDEGDLDDVEALATLIAMTLDEDDDVRDWVTFAVGQHFVDDTPEVREALRERLEDPHDDTRIEAIAGLARRGDAIALDPLRTELDDFTVRDILIEAAMILSDPCLLEPLEKQLRFAEERVELVQEAIKRCRENSV